MSNNLYIFYGIEIPKEWTKWDGEKVTISNGDWSVDVPVTGGEPVLFKDTGYTVEDYELTLYHYPHDHADAIWTSKTGLLGFFICEIHAYGEDTDSLLDGYEKWTRAHQCMTNFDTALQNVCKELNFNYVQPKLLTSLSECRCCQ